jgi:hypothetical protein
LGSALARAACIWAFKASTGRAMRTIQLGWNQACTARLFGWIARPTKAQRTNLLSLATTRTRHLGNDPNLERYDSDLWTDEFAFLNQRYRNSSIFA